jgi:hypothetical protein
MPQVEHKLYSSIPLSSDRADYATLKEEYITIRLGVGSLTFLAANWPGIREALDALTEVER